ncbi:MAG: NUDIX hydrolase [Merismopedia sp. SIO2A8]|nr:NUDIX hydrolase [Symploca sp. SIO2B6]NET47545.1 NUDIX hydrolase [Merismopedia sp. SIO2A8]
MMKKPRIRPIAICVFQHNDRILVHQGYDNVKQESFYRPLGGGIDVGELSGDAVVREIKEELNADILHPRLLGILESVFTYNDQLGHEIVFVYDAQFVDTALYAQEKIIAVEGKRQFEAEWRSLQSLRSEEQGRLVPEDLWSLLDSEPGGQNRLK